MFYSKLQYARNLRKEINALELQLKRDMLKRVRDYEKEAKSKAILKQIRNEQSAVATEIRNWLETAPLSAETKEQVVDYYIHAKTVCSDNFIRTIKYCFNEI